MSPSRILLYARVLAFFFGVRVDAISEWYARELQAVVNGTRHPVFSKDNQERVFQHPSNVNLLLVASGNDLASWEAEPETILPPRPLDWLDDDDGLWDPGMVANPRRLLAVQALARDLLAPFELLGMRPSCKDASDPNKETSNSGSLNNAQYDYCRPLQDRFGIVLVDSASEMGKNLLNYFAEEPSKPTVFIWERTSNFRWRLTDAALDGEVFRTFIDGWPLKLKAENPFGDFLSAPAPANLSLTEDKGTGKSHSTSDELIRESLNVRTAVGSTHTAEAYDEGGTVFSLGCYYNSGEPRAEGFCLEATGTFAEVSRALIGRDGTLRLFTMDLKANQFVDLENPAGPKLVLRAPSPIVMLYSPGAPPGKRKVFSGNRPPWMMQGMNAALASKPEDLIGWVERELPSKKANDAQGRQSSSMHEEL